MVVGFGCLPTPRPSANTSAPPLRIEDDILVTADGNRNLSAGLPRRSDEVEAWAAGQSASRAVPSV